MSNGRLAQLKPTLCRTLLLATLPLACAVAQSPVDDGGQAGSAGSVMGGGGSGMAGAAGSLPVGGTPESGGSGGSPNPSGGSAGRGAGGGASGGVSGGGASGGGGKGGAGGGAGSGTCTSCLHTIAWVDNATLGFVTGDCLKVGDKTFLYTGTKMQMYANSQCNPMKQQAWCADNSNDYKFMPCN